MRAATADHARPLPLGAVAHACERARQRYAMHFGGDDWLRLTAMFSDRLRDPDGPMRHFVDIKERQPDGRYRATVYFAGTHLDAVYDPRSDAVVTVLPAGTWDRRLARGRAAA